MIYLLQSSISPVLDDFEFTFDSRIVEFMTPGKDTTLNILKNEPINLFVFMNEKFSEEEFTNIKMKYYDSV